MSTLNCRLKKKEMEKQDDVMCVMQCYSGCMLIKTDYPDWNVVKWNLFAILYALLITKYSGMILLEG